MKQTRKLIKLAVIVGLGAVIAGCGGSRKADADSPPSAAVVKAVRRDLTSKLQIASEFQPNQEIEVYAKVSGYISKLYVDWGTHVKQGQLLATLEIPELQQQVAQDEAAIRRSEQDLARAREELHRAESAYAVAHVTYTRLAEVQKSRPEMVAQQEVDIAQGKDQEASAGVSAARDAQASAEQSLEVARAANEKDKAMYAYARITAPFDGVVTEVYAYKGALLPAGTSSSKGDLALCHLSQNNLLRLVIPIPERAVAGVRAGESVDVQVGASHQRFPGKIVRLAGQIDTQTRTMHVEVDVPNAKYELVPGMYASVEIPLQKAMSVLALPIQSVQVASEGRGSVYVVNKENKIEKRDVTLGLQTASFIEITSGVQENELVLFGEVGQYKPRQAVNPKVTEPSVVE
jgi:RND family efflux transporter MFP subunit